MRKRLQLVLLFFALATWARAQNCPTGFPCGVTASYCTSYTPPSTSGATAISSLTTGYGGAYLITSPGNYYLSADLSVNKSGIAILTTSGSVDINLNGHTLTYGGTADGSGSSQIGEYGILMCNTGNIGSESLNSAYGSNGLCVSGGLSAPNVTIENGTITQSTNASQYYDPNNCPGSGVDGSSCANPHDTIASHVIVSQYNHGLKITHVTLNFQNVDSRGILYQNQQPGTGMDIECNTLNDKVTQLNSRPEAHAAIWSGNLSSGNSANTVQYNTVVGSPQNGIAVGVGGTETTGTVVKYNDINQGYYQCTTPPCTASSSGLKMYSNDYGLGGCASAGEISYNYIHSVVGRGIGCIYGSDQNNETVHDNYVNSAELAVNGEYGSNGTVNGGSWVGGCEIQGSRGFESKASPAMQIYGNTFIQNVSQCGSVGIKFVEFPCTDITCPSTATHTFTAHDNTIQMNNSSGSSTLVTPQEVSCFGFDTAQGNYSNYFTSAFINNTCTTDGDFAVTIGYNPGDYFSFYSSNYTIGSHPLSSGCGGSSGSSCGHMMHWQGQTTPPPDELGFIFRDITFGNGATANFAGDTGTPTARAGTVQWTQKVYARGANNGLYIQGATVTYTDTLSNTYGPCTTDTTGSCNVVVNQFKAASPSGNSTITNTNYNNYSLSVAASGCTANNSSGLNITSTNTTTVTLAGCSGTILPSGAQVGNCTEPLTTGAAVSRQAALNQGVQENTATSATGIGSKPTNYYACHP